MIKKIFKITSDILLYCFIFLGLITIIITLSSKKDIDGATNIFNYQLRLVITDSMDKCSETNVSKYKIKSIPKNSLVLIKKIEDNDYKKIKEGDVLTFRYLYTEQVTITHRVKSIVEKENQPFNKYVNYIRQAASYAALALSPVTGFGQILQGFWNSIKVTLAQSKQPDAFNFSDLRKAFILCYRDMFSRKEPTLMQLINELYALNDMDMNVHKIVESLKSDKRGILNLDRFLFKTVSRPDYYNRGILFAAQMIHDGVLDTDPNVSAHYIRDGKLVYDITRDKRFAALNDKNHPDYNK
jgi:hypothetical protein